MIDKLRGQIAEAMKAGDKQRVSILRVLMGELQKANIDQDGPEVHKIVRKLIEGNNETIAIFDKRRAASLVEEEIIMYGARQRLLEDENKVLQGCLPSYLTNDQIKVALEPMLQAIKEAKNNGQAIGFAMRYLKDKAVEGGTVKQVVEELRQ